MRLRVLAVLTCLTMPLPALADDTASQPPAEDVFSYSTLAVDHLRQHSDYFSDSSQGNGAALSYDFGDTYVFGQWNKLDFDRLAGHHSLEGIGVGAHQAYSSTTSFYIDLAFFHDQLSPKLSDRSDNFWRIDYGLRAQATTMIELDAAIFTERNSDFGRRPFGERVGGGLDFSKVSLLGALEHTADGNRVQFSLVWTYH
ncbi:MAG TPA: hypothetical protein VLV87_09600 [Gammaproteobacteria bacterium]|nr:hypothetical protein [Gammaproteobacteria bacterium]